MEGALLLHAVVPTPEAPGALGRALGIRSVAHGAVAAIVGPARREGATRSALRHARVVAHAVEECSAVVPFRLGMEFGSEEEVQDLLAENRRELSGRLGEMSGRVEMGLKVRIPELARPDAKRLEAALDRVRVLASGSEHRQERRKPVPGAVVLEGFYLLPRCRIESFWTEVDALRSDTGLRVLGTGPWAPYSFCELSLRPAANAASGHPSPGNRSLS
jgi:hypothetical protein